MIQPFLDDFRDRFIRNRNSHDPITRNSTSTIVIARTIPVGTAPARFVPSGIVDLKVISI